LKLVKNTMFVLIVALYSTISQASFLIEPHVGFNVAGGGTTGTTAYSYNGTQLGMRLGGQFLGLMAGVDYTTSSYTWERKATSTFNDSFSRGEWGAFVGYNLPLFLRFWGAYYFSSKATDQENSGQTVSNYEYSGSTKELGLGFTGLPFMSINLIYRMVDIDKQTTNAGVVTNYSGSSVISNHEVVLGVSAPFTLL
jgi:hypothetical protein